MPPSNQNMQVIKKAINQTNLGMLQAHLTQLNLLLQSMSDIALASLSISGQVKDSIDKTINANSQRIMSYANVVKASEYLEQHIERKQRESENKTIIFKVKPNVSPADVLIEVNNRIKEMRSNNSKVMINKVIKSGNFLA